MKNSTKIILFILTAALLFSSMLQKHFNFRSFKPLKGTVVDQPMPELQFESFYHASFQQQTEQHLKLHFGYREPLIRLYNQYLWDFYRETKVAGSQIIFGKDYWIYEPWVVANYYQWQFHAYAADSTAMAKMFSEEAERLLQLQQVLESYDVHLFVCLVPSKDLVCPEYLPDNWETRYDDEPKFSSRFFNEEEYTRLGINHLNLEQYFLDIKDTVDFALFPQTGIHWSKYAALFASDTLVRYMENLGDINMHNLVFGQRHLENAIDPDDDLESLMNLIRPLPKPQYYYANVTADNDTTAVKPKIIVVGDSFWWTVAYQLPLSDFFSDSPYWYYNNSVYYYPPYKTVDELDIADELLTSDFVILFYSASTQYRMNDGFTLKALEALTGDSVEVAFDTAAFIERKTRSIMDEIMATPAWMETVRQKAKEKGISTEQALHNDAKWVVLNNIKEGKIKWPTSTENAFDTTAFIERETQRVVNSIMATPEWANDIREKAAQRGIDFDRALHENAKWVVYHDIEEGKIKWPTRKQKQ